MSNETTKAYLIGGGIGSLAAAAFMLRDGAMRGDNISVYEAAGVLGGSLDGAGNPIDGYLMRGGRMFTADNYECTWDLFKSIPSLVRQGKTVLEETLDFNDQYASNAKARLVDRRRAKLAVTSMGFSMQDRRELLDFSQMGEEDLGGKCITDCFSPAFFETAFWYMWSTTFAFQPWHSAVELRRYLLRFLLEFPRIDTLAGVKRTIYNQYDSLVLPLKSWLVKQGVRFVTDCTVTSLSHNGDNDRFVVTGIQIRRHQLNGGIHVNVLEAIDVRVGDLVFIQNGSMTDASSVGSTEAAPVKRGKNESASWTLWEQLAEGRRQFGNPAVFNSCIAQSYWESFTVTLSDPAFFDLMTEFSGNEPGTGGLVTFKDSNWLLSIVLPHQPHFKEQPSGVQVFWGYALFPDRVGNFVPKPMCDCNGGEILRELLGHLRFDPEIVESARCNPCRMPYLTSMFMPRRAGDRPLPVPVGSQNLAFVSQFVEIADDVVFTVEYSVRAAQLAVYQLLGIDRPVPPVTQHADSFWAKFEAVIKAFK